MFVCFPWVWLTQILKILHCLDPSEWLPQTEHCVHLSPKEFLIWTMDIASHERFAPSAPCADSVQHMVLSVIYSMNLSTALA